MRTFLFPFFLTICIFATAQNYQFFRDDYTLFRSGSMVFPYETISVIDSGGARYYRFRHMISEFDSWLVDIDGPGFLGDRAIWYPDSLYVLFNRYGDSIRIYTNKQVGESWMCFRNEADTVWGTVQEIDVVEADSRTDTVQTIGFYCPTCSANSINDYVFRICSNRGLVNFCSIAIFPEVSNALYNSGFGEFSGGDTGYQKFHPDSIENILQSQLFNLYPGEEIHTEYEALSLGYYYIEAKAIKKVEMRQEFDDSIVITYKVKFKKTIDGVVTEEYIDVMTRRYRKNRVLNHTPYHVDSSNLGNYAFIPAVGSKFGRLALFSERWELVPHNDSIWEIIHGDKRNKLGTEHYIEGLGGPYHYHTGFATSENRLVYFKKNNGDTWGTPLDFVVDIDKPQEDEISLYPNPVKDKLYVNKGNKTLTLLKIFSPFGHLVAQYQLDEPNSTIDLGRIDHGIYFYRIVAKRNIVKAGKFIVE